MAYIVSEVKSSWKWIQLITRSVDIMEQPTSQQASQSLSLSRQQFLFDIQSRYMMMISYRQRINKLHFLLLLKIDAVLYEFHIFL